MRDKKYLLLGLVLMAVGFAAVSTTLYINGNTAIKTDTKFDGDVIFTDVSMDDPTTKAKTDTEKGGTATIVASSSGKEISFTTGNLSSKGNTSTLNYEVTNYNTNYDANVSITCGAPADATAEEKTNFNKLVTVVASDPTTTILAGQTYTGTVTVTLVGSALGDNGEGVDLDTVCTLVANAVEK